MHHLCPYLALADDGRSVVDGYDPGHACHAARPVLPVDRARQAQLCLTEAHPRCERFVTAQQAQAGDARRPAPDLAFRSSRLVIHPDSGWRPLRRGRGQAGRWRGWRPAVVLGSLVVVLVAGLAAAGVSGVLPLPWFGAPGQSPAESAAAASGTPGPAPSSSPSLAPTGSPTATPEPSLTPADSPSPLASQLTYVVQPGDTLGAIAQRFGTTTAALVEANQIADPNNLVPGQVLIIP